MLQDSTVDNSWKWNCLRAEHVSNNFFSGFKHLFYKNFFSAVEPQILDFQTQQHKLFPLLARCYAYGFAGQSVKEMFQQVMAEVQRGIFSRLIEVSLSLMMKKH